jgi:hypothetical protein
MLGGVRLWGREGQRRTGFVEDDGWGPCVGSREVLAFWGTWAGFSLGSLMKLFWPIMVFQPSLQSM